MSISYRLKYLVDLIENKVDVLADIGTDHGYLPIYAMETKKANFIYAVDINEEPLMVAKNNINKKHLDNKIKTILSDGLKFTLDSNIKKINIVTISGLGTSTIKNILSDDNNKIEQYIICSNTEISELRKMISEFNYEIKFEDFIVDNNKNYFVIWINKNNVFDKKDNLQFGNEKWFKNNNHYLNYLKSEIDKNNKIIENLNINLSKKELINKFENENAKIEEYIHGINKNNKISK